jgi:thioredoxin-related protein
MKLILGVLILIFCLAFTGWQLDFGSAVNLARQRHQLILINFSGSDWCIPCVKMKKTIFDRPVFAQMSDTTLVLFNADFPRSKKNQPDQNLRKQNETLADKYNPSGKFPFTVLINTEGTIIKSWDGLPAQTAEQFTNELKILCDANKR